MRYAALGTSALLVLAACTSAPPDEPRTTSTPAAASSARPSAAVPAPVWSEIPLPGRPAILTLTTSSVPSATGEPGVLVGVSRAGAPGVFHLRGGAAPSPVAVVPTSGYAHVAAWVAAAGRGRSVVAIGGAPGGAHANTRWTVWTATSPTGPLVEEPQSFATFGGYGAGDLVGVAYAGADPLLVGSWEGAGPGTDVTTWVREGARWVRLSSAGTALASTASELPSAVAASFTDRAAVIGGTVTELREGLPRRPVAWASTQARGAWARVELPSGETSARVAGLSCDASACLVVGTAARPGGGAALLAWTLTCEGAGAPGGRPTPGSGGTGASGRPWSVTPEPLPAPADLPALAAAPGKDPSTVSIPAPVVSGARAWVALPTAGRVTVLRREPSGWSAAPGPDGVPISLAQAGTTLYLATRGPDGLDHLWSAPAP